MEKQKHPYTTHESMRVEGHRPKEHPLWEKFDEWVKESGMVFIHTKHRMMTFTAFVEGYRQSQKVTPKKKLKI